MRGEHLDPAASAARSVVSLLATGWVLAAGRRARAVLYALEDPDAP